MKQTRKEIQNAFLKLAACKPVDKITVRELVETCSLNRNSFYYYFEDMSDLIESIIEDIFSEHYQDDLYENPREAGLAMAEHLQKYKYLCANIYRSKEKEYLDLRLGRLVRQIVRRFLDSARFSRYDLQESDRRLIEEVYQAEVFGLFRLWMSDSHRSLGEIFSRIYDLRKGTLQRMLEIADQNSSPNEH